MKKPDLYHTCYSLAGMSIAQHKSDYENLLSESSTINEIFNGEYESLEGKT
jgi:prenyltransferase beta subunit